MMVIFVVVIFGLISRQYATFDTRSSDLDRFIQGMWNTLNGRFLYSTIEERSIMGGHFTPYFVLLAPALYIWPDPRVFSLIQTIGLAVGGFFLYLIVRQKHPTLAPLIALAFFLNPSLHQVGLLELRRIMLAVPYLSMALYGLSIKDKRWVFAGLFVALLCKENVALPMAMVGVYYLLFERDWKFGFFLIIFAVGWVLMVLTVINPLVDPQYTQAENSLDAYRGFNYFAEYGSTPQAIIGSLLRQPLAILQYMFNGEAQVGLMRLFLPLGFVLPFLSPKIALIAVPNMIYMLLGSYEIMHRLDAWYVTIPVTIFFGAICFRIKELSPKWATALTVSVLGFSILGYQQFSLLPFGGRHVPVRNIVTEHHQKAAEVMALVPIEADLATQSAFTPHLALRSELFLFPWLPRSGAPMDYYLLDKNLKSYPLNEIERNEAINNVIADPLIVVEEEIDNIYLFNLDGTHHAANRVDMTWEQSILLERYEIAVTNEDGFFKTTTGPIELKEGQDIRVTFYWRATAVPEADRTISVRLSSGEQLLTQHDMVPSNGARPTSWWQPDWYFRDVYYLTVPIGLAADQYELNLLLYDSLTLDPIPNDNGDAFVLLNHQ